MKVLEPGLRKVAVALYEHLNTPRALTAHLLLRYKEWDQLASLAADPTNYLEGSIGAEKFRRDAQASDFLRKSPLLPTSVDRKAKAVESFWESEKQCFHTNQLLRLLQYPAASDDAVLDRFRSILNGARKICKRVLGRVPDSLDGRFGPGTSFELRGSAFATQADKMWITPHTTPECAPVFEHMYWRTHWGRTRLRAGLPLPALTRGNRFTTVPKDALKDRGICIEPLGNLWVQLAVGGEMKRRLANVGLKVNRTAVPDCPIQRLQTRPALTGETLHRILARKGSIDGSWATIDLSNASDTVAFELVRWLLPSDWFDLLCACRSPFTLVDDQWVRLDKFSSMGNGATFELETLIFAALAAAGCGLNIGSEVFVYGDDILVPTQHSHEVLAILRMAGFTPNERKTFTTGPFRESCGGDFFSGQPVRSYYAKGKMETPLEWMACHNELIARWPSARLALLRCTEQVPLQFRVFGPPQLGGVFAGTPSRTWVEDGIKWSKRLVPMPLRLPLDRWGEDFILSLALIGVSSRGITPRDSVVGFRLTRCSVS